VNAKDVEQRSLIDGRKSADQVCLLEMTPGTRACLIVAVT
jgi:hypothetical protein